MGLTKSAAGVSWSLPSGEFQDREFDIYSERLIDTWYRDPVRRAWASRTWGGRAPRVVLEIFAAGAWSAELDRQLALTGRSGQTIRQLAKVDHDTYNSLASMSTERWLGLGREGDRIAEGDLRASIGAIRLERRRPRSDYPRWNVSRQVLRAHATYVVLRLFEFLEELRIFVEASFKLPAELIARHLRTRRAAALGGMLVCASALIHGIVLRHEITEP